MTKDGALECWFLTGSQALYGDETLAQVAQQSQEIVNALNASGDLASPIRWRPVLTTADGIKAVCEEANTDPRCIGVITWMHTFSPAKAWIGGLAALHKPLLHLHTQLHRTLPWAEIDMDFMNLNQAAHGDREFGHIQMRMGIRRKTIAGHHSDPTVRHRLSGWQRAALGRHAGQQVRLARFGDNMREVAVTEGDKVQAQIAFGMSVNAYGIDTLSDLIERAAPDAVDDTVTAYLDQYDVADQLRPGADRHESLRVAAAIEVGLRRFLEDGGFTAFTTNFEDLGRLRQLPGIGVQRLMADGYGFGGEGDWKTAALLRSIKAMTAGLPGGTSFMEDYTYHFGPGAPKILGAHMLEVCPSIAAGRPRCEVHRLSIGGREDPVRLVFDAAPGAGLVVGLVDVGDRFRIVANEIEVVPPDEDLRSLPVARAVWLPEPTLSTSAEAWIAAGGPHHTVLSTALDRETLEDFAEMTAVELVTIDAETTIPRFRNELRWSAAYYRFADGVRA
jgi:L-arabinose isomerase